MLTYVNRKCVLMFTPAFPVSRFIAIVFYSLQQVYLGWLTDANLKSFSASTRGGLTRVQRCMHNVYGSAHDASTKVYCTRFNYIWKMDLGSLTLTFIFRSLIIILFLVEYLMHILYSTSLKLHKSLANFKKFFYFFG